MPFLARRISADKLLVRILTVTVWCILTDAPVLIVTVLRLLSPMLVELNIPQGLSRTARMIPALLLLAMAIVWEPMDITIDTVNAIMVTKVVVNWWSIIIWCKVARFRAKTAPTCLTPLLLSCSGSHSTAYMVKRPRIGYYGGWVGKPWFVVETGLNWISLVPHLYKTLSLIVLKPNTPG